MLNEIKKTEEAALAQIEKAKHDAALLVHKAHSASVDALEEAERRALRAQETLVVEAEGSARKEAQRIIEKAQQEIARPFADYKGRTEKAVTALMRLLVK